MTDKQAIKEFLRAEIDRTVTDDFQLLLRIPSTTTWRVIDYVRKLDPMRQAELFDAFAGNALFLLFPDHDPMLHAFKTGNVEYRKLCDALPLMGDWKYQNVRSLRMMASDGRSAKSRGISVGVPVEVMARAETIEPTDASAIRKCVKSLFITEYGARAENVGGGVWSYSAVQNKSTVKILIDYGGRSDQLRYEVQFEDAATGIRSNRLTYEGMLGFGFGQWDYVTAANLDEAIALLRDNVNYLLRIPDRLKG